MKRKAKILLLIFALILVLITAGYFMEQKKEYKIDESLKGRVNLILVEKSKRILFIFFIRIAYTKV